VYVLADHEIRLIEHDHQVAKSEVCVFRVRIFNWFFCVVWLNV